MIDKCDVIKVIVGVNIWKKKSLVQLTNLNLVGCFHWKFKWFDIRLSNSETVRKATFSGKDEEKDISKKNKRSKGEIWVERLKISR